jgi:hypothetical protein
MLAVTVLSLLAASPGRSIAGPADGRIEFRGGHVVFEVIGQVNNFAAGSATPLGSSNQFGYLSSLEGVSDVFTDPLPPNQNETTAALTFFTQVTTTRVTSHGPFSVVVRDGLTTIYRNAAPASFAAPDSFRAGTPVLSATIHQQVIVDTIERTFTVVNMSTVTSTARFELDGDWVRLGRRGDVFRTTLSGVLRIRDGVPPPTGHFAGYAVAVEPSGEQD